VVREGRSDRVDFCPSAFKSRRGGSEVRAVARPSLHSCCALSHQTCTSRRTAHPPNSTAAACGGDDAEDSGGCAEMAMVMTVDTESGSLGRLESDVDVCQSRTHRRRLRTFS
jgi:hypothetical protein